MKEIKLTRGKVAIVDDEDYPQLSKLKWTFAQAGTKSGYAMHYYREGAKVKAIIMHRLVMGAMCGEILDHKNGNGLDNRKENLRFCTAGENARNKRPRDGKYKGVTASGKKWAAQITYKRTHFYLGTFDTPEAAALAYNKAAKKHHGKFAHLNVIKGARNG